MKLSTRVIAAAALAGVASFGVTAGSATALTTTQKKAIQKVGSNAYIYGYAPVYMNTSISRFPTNALLNVRYLATDQTRAIVKPNADTLYTIAVLDVGAEPVIVKTPATGSRYFGLELLDSYTNVFGYIGSRVTGTSGGYYAIVGPNWKSSTTPLKRPVSKTIRSSTAKLWVIGRTLIDGSSDLPAVQALQNGITVQRNSKVGTSENLLCVNSIQPGQTPASGCVGLPAASTSTPPAFPSPNAAFFKDLGTIMKTQVAPATQDKTILASMKKYGIGAGLDPSKTQSAAVLAELVKGAVSADAAIDAGLVTARKKSVSKNNGWILFDKIGVYGKDYLTRAIIAKFGLGANLPAEAVYPAAVTDYSGKTLNGASGAVYRVRFPSGQLPPTTSAFWSLTLYAEDQFFISNPLNRFAIGDRPFPAGGSATANLSRGCGPSGATDIYVSAVQPSSTVAGACAGNWLPAPAEQFNLMLRIYRPTSAVLNGTWKYPQIIKVG